MVMVIYLRNALRLLGLLAVTVGIVLIGYQGWMVLHEGVTLAFYFCGPESVPHWLFHAGPLVQGFLGWPWVILVEVPMHLLLLLGGGALIEFV